MTEAEHADPTCDKCGAPITTAMMPMICPHGRQCGFVEDDDHWTMIEQFRGELGIERVRPAAEAVARAVIGARG